MKYLGTMLLWVLGAVFLAGCSSAREYTFDVSVKNDSAGPVTIWLTKDGPPLEQGWRSPEQVALRSPGHEERIGGVLVPPGKTASTGPIKGKFEPGTFAWLRIYDGKYESFSDLLAVSPRSSKRVDQPLDPGVNQLVVRSRNGRIHVETASPAATQLSSK